MESKNLSNDITFKSVFDASSDSSLYEFKKSLEAIQDKLLEYGLSLNQSKVYLYLEKYGSKTASDVSKTLKIPRTETYHLLTVLQNKGIVFATFEHPIKFQTIPFEKAIFSLINSEKEHIKLLEEIGKKLSETWKGIPTFQLDEEKIEEKFQMLQGSNQINSKIGEMTDGFDKEFLVLGSEKDFLKLYHGEFLELFVKSTQPFRFLSGCTEKTKYVFDDLQRNNIRQLSGNIENHLYFLIRDNVEILFFIHNSNSSKELSAMWTNSKSMISSMTLLFESIWKNSKKIHL